MAEKLLFLKSRYRIYDSTTEFIKKIKLKNVFLVFSNLSRRYPKFLLNYLIPSIIFLICLVFFFYKMYSFDIQNMFKLYSGIKFVI